MRNDRRRRSLRMEALERREVLAAAVVSFALFDDNNGTPGEPLAHVEENQSFFLELSAEETHELYQGLGAVSVSLKWDPQRLALDPEFDPNVAITNALPFHHAKVDAEAGRIDDLSGALFFNSGQPIGDAGPERFALLRFQAQDIAGPAGLSLAEGPSGTVLYPMGSPTMFFDRQDILIVEPGFIDEPGGQINDDLVIFVDPPYVSDIVVEDQNIVDQGKADRQPPPAPLADQSKADELAPKTDELAPKTDELAPKAEEALAATSVAKAALAPPPLPSRPGATATPPGAVAPITALPGNNDSTIDDSTIDNSTNDNSTNDAPGAEKPPVETPSDELQPSDAPPIAIRSVARLLKRMAPAEATPLPTAIPSRPGMTPPRSALADGEGSAESRPPASPWEQETFCVPSAAWDAASSAVSETTVSVGPHMPEWARPARRVEPQSRHDLADANAPASRPEIESEPLALPVDEHLDDVTILPVGPLEDFQPLDASPDQTARDVATLPSVPLEAFEPLRRPLAPPTSTTPATGAVGPESPLSLRFRLISSLDDGLLTSLAESQLASSRST